MSSLYSYENGAASLAVDGNANGDWRARSCTHTANEVRPWWAVDLGSPTTVFEVEIANRIDDVPGTTQLMFTELVCK